MSGIALLCERSRSYLKTIKKRGEFLAAAERFYLEVLVCQWRLEALDVQLRAATMCSSAAVVGATVDGDSSTAIQMSLGDAISRRREILNGVHSEITSHQEAARAAIEDRATHYGLSAAPTCHVDRLARGKVERGRALERLRQLVDNTYADIILESHGMVRISLDDDGLRRLRASIDRRHKYWQAELEDTWAAWQGATKKMHDLGDQALRAWNELATTAISLLRVRAWPTCMREEFAKGLGLAVVDIFEAEHLESLGLSGLRDTSSPSPCGVSRSARNCGNDVSVCGAAGDVKAFAVPEFSTAGRLYLIAAILELLHRADGLHFVGDALLKCELASHDGLPGNNIPALLDFDAAGAAAVAVGVTSAALSIPFGAFAATAEAAVASLGDDRGHRAASASCVAACLVSAVQRASRRCRSGSLHDAATADACRNHVRALLAFGRRLGGVQLEDALRGASQEFSSINRQSNSFDHTVADDIANSSIWGVSLTANKISVSNELHGSTQMPTHKPWSWPSGTLQVKTILGTDGIRGNM